MKTVQKRMIAAGCICVLLIGGAVVVSRHSTYEQKEKEAENGTETASVSRVVKQPADLTFWYSDESYQEFLKKRQKNIMRIPVLSWMQSIRTAWITWMLYTR